MLNIRSLSIAVKEPLNNVYFVSFIFFIFFFFKVKESFFFKVSLPDSTLKICKIKLVWSLVDLYSVGWGEDDEKNDLLGGHPTSSKHSFTNSRFWNFLFICSQEMYKIKYYFTSKTHYGRIKFLFICYLFEESFLYVFSITNKLLNYLNGESFFKLK